MTAQRKLRLEPYPYAVADAQLRPRLADATDVARDREAVHLLQDRLNQAFVSEGSKWSPRKTTALVLVTCGSFWLGAATLLYATLH
jgi:hypothetical protein